MNFTEIKSALLDAHSAIETLEKQNKALLIEENKLLKEREPREKETLFRPMKYDDFKRLKLNEQTAYIMRLRRRYNVKTRDLADMMGCEYFHLNAYCKRHGIQIDGRAKTDKDAWESFLNTDEVIR